MGDDDLTKQHVIYGSAGMAAAGMIPSGKARARQVPAEAPAPADAETEREVENFPPEAVPEVEPTTGLKQEPPRVTGLKAVVMGETGAGNFGDGLDKVFNRLDGVRLMALSDENASGLESSQARAGAPRGYTNYREMLAAEQPDLVSVAPRWTNQHYEMVKASLEAGAHVYCETPFTQTLKEADELVALAAKKNLKLAVAHQMRCDPHIQNFLATHEDLIGELREMHVFGKSDHRAGGEDLLVLGPRLFDVVRLFAGDVSYCTASITKDGIPAIAEDAHESEKENLGPLLGDTIRADLVMDSGVHVSFVSDQTLRETQGPWGILFVGTKGRMRLFADHPPTFSHLQTSKPEAPIRQDQWVMWPAVAGEYHAPVDNLVKADGANRRVVKDWLAAIAEDREPESSGERAAKTLEMIHGVWQAGITMKRAYFPLVNRLHPLSE